MGGTGEGEDNDGWWGRGEGMETRGWSAGDKGRGGEERWWGQEGRGQGGWVATDLLLCGDRLQLGASALPIGHFFICLFLACRHLQVNINRSLE